MGWSDDGLSFEIDLSCPLHPDHRCARGGRRWPWRALVVGWCLLVVGSLAWVLQPAEGASGEAVPVQRDAVASGYFVDGQTALFETATSATVDSTGYTSAISGETAFAIGRRTTIPVNCRFSDSNAVATVTCWFRSGSVVTGMEQLTFTPTTVQDADSRYMSETQLLDTMGATSVYIVLTAVDSGTVNVWAGSY